MAKKKNYDTIDRLIAVIESRRQADPKDSYVARLVEKGRKKMAQKVGEEGVEVAMAAVSESRQALVEESADLLFHLLVLLSEAEIDFDDVLKELGRRDGISGIDEKASRKR